MWFDYFKVERAGMVFHVSAAAAEVGTCCFNHDIDFEQLKVSFAI